MDRPDERPTEALGHTVKVLRVDRDLSRRELAERAGISYSYLAEIENGDKPPSSSVLSRLADALGLQPSELMAAAESRTGRREAWAPSKADYLPAKAPPRKRMWFGKGEKSVRPRADRVEEPWDQMEAFSAQASPPTPEDPAAHSERSQALGEVVALFDRLSDDDVERVLDLVRRLARS